MKPMKFKEQTGTLLKPDSMTDEECGALPIHRTKEYLISCWKMNFKERIKAVLFGKIWVWVWSNSTQPPIALQCEKTVFEKDGK